MMSETEHAMKRIVGLCLTFLLALPVSVHAADRWYQVEVIVFQNLAPETSEEWPLTPGYPQMDAAIELAEAPDMSAEVLDAEEQAMLQEPAGGGPAAQAFVALTPDKLTLEPLYRRLKRSAGYRPLLYKAWQQPALGRGEAQAVHLMARDEPDSDALMQPRADGWLRLRSSHFLHVDTDLVFYIGDLPNAGNAEIIRLTETRRVKLNEVHYLDNPLFGVLVKVSPLAIEAGAEP